MLTDDHILEGNVTSFSHALALLCFCVCVCGLSQAALLATCVDRRVRSFWRPTNFLLFCGPLRAAGAPALAWRSTQSGSVTLGLLLLRMWAFYVCVELGLFDLMYA